MIDEPLGKRRVNGHAERKPYTHQAHGQSASAAEPLCSEVVTAEHQRSLPEESKGGESDRQQEQVGDESEGGDAGAEQQCNPEHDDTDTEAVDQTADEGQAEGGQQRRPRIGGGYGGARDSQVFADRGDEDAEGVGLAGAAGE